MNGAKVMKKTGSSGSCVLLDGWNTILDAGKEITPRADDHLESLERGDFPVHFADTRLAPSPVITSSSESRERGERLVAAQDYTGQRLRIQVLTMADW